MPGSKPCKSTARANPEITNNATFTVSPHVALDDPTMGGAGGYRLRKQVIDYLLKTDFRMLYPGHLRSIVSARRRTACGISN